MRLVLLVLVGGCGIADFDVDQPIMEQRIAGSPLPGPLATLFPLPLNIDISAKIQAMHTGPIDRVTLASLELAITPTAMPAGDGDDWSFIDAIEVYVSSSKSGSTLPKVKLAHLASPGAVTRLDFTIEPGVNLEPYISEGSVVEGDSTGRAPPDDVTYDGTGVFSVHPL